MRELLKAGLRALALGAVSPVLLSFAIKARLIGRNRALAGSSQLLALVPGLPGQYLRRAFLCVALAHCDPTATIEFGTIFSQAGARIDAHVYVGPRCHLGLVHLERDVLIAAGVHVPSGGATHDFSDVRVPIRAQPHHRSVVRIGEGSWIASGCVVMADVGRHTVVGAGSIVTRPLPDYAVAVGSPARVVRSRLGDASATA
ncbi:MAG TPA: acyltransferase [Vicinamibacterales bacterium]|nr:acyltransferase [Vicinamibacterales bacterium]